MRSNTTRPGEESSPNAGSGTSSRLAGAHRGAAGVVLPLLALLSCGGDADAPTEPEPPSEPALGSIEVTTATSGGEPDPDGYTLTVDGEDPGRTIATDDTLVITDLDEGERSLELGNLAANCGVEGENPRTVSVAPADTASTNFAVTCEGRSAIEVTTATVAGGLAEDGFRVAVDGGEPRTIGADDTEVFTGLASGDHTVEISGVDTGCSIDGDNPRAVTVPADDTAAVTFEGRCGLRGRIVFASNRSGGEYDIWLMDAGGSNLEPLTQDGDVSFTHPAVSPDGSRIAFQRETENEIGVWVMDADGSNRRPLADEEEATETNPAWSPDGSRIAFRYLGPGGAWFEDGDIWVMESDGTDPVRLTHSSGDTAATDPAWSPDGSRIAYTLQHSFDIFIDNFLRVIESDGSTPPEELSPPDVFFDGKHPTWSPSGDRVAFVGTRNAPGDVIYVMCVNESLPAEILVDADASGPSWSPDGSHIVYSALDATDETSTDDDIWMMESDGSNPEPLTEHEASDIQPAWTPQTTSGPPVPPGPSGECQVVAPSVAR